MKPVILLVGRLHDVIANVAEQHRDLPVEWLGAHTLDEVRQQLDAEPAIATVIIGGSLDDQTRGALIGQIAARRPDLNMHFKNRAEGPAGMAPFVRRIVLSEVLEPVT